MGVPSPALSHETPKAEQQAALVRRGGRKRGKGLQPSRKRADSLALPCPRVHVGGPALSGAAQKQSSRLPWRAEAVEKEEGGYTVQAQPQKRAGSLALLCPKVHVGGPALSGAAQCWRQQALPALQPAHKKRVGGIIKGTFGQPLPETAQRGEERGRCTAREEARKALEEAWS
ncbi:hypothetical protein L7F22_034842 [Adiantum nelumboides]|nr:hypothetical protein [Adiantum nelumboides]